MSDDSVSSGGAVVPVPVVAELASPSLYHHEDARSENGPPAYEVKFLLTEEQAGEVAGRVSRSLAPDPHADPALGGAYRVTSLYTDTPAFEVFRRVGAHARSKFRVRRYGAGGPAFLERKDKDGDRVWKYRTPVGEAELSALDAADPADWSGHWFRHQLGLRQLRPVCRVSYERVAFLGTADGGTVRVTLDRRVRGEVADGWELAAVGTGPELAPGMVICEFKFRLGMPGLFKEVVRDLGLNLSSVSKYRRFVSAAGLAPATVPVAGGRSPDA